MFAHHPLKWSMCIPQQVGLCMTVCLETAGPAGRGDERVASVSPSPKALPEVPTLKAYTKLGSKSSLFF